MTISDVVHRFYNDYLQGQGLRSADIDVNTAVFEYLDHQGYYGSLDDRWKQFADDWGVEYLGASKMAIGRATSDFKVLLGSRYLSHHAAEDTSLITITGSGVSSWKDRVKNYELIQTVDADRPTYSSTSFNGFPGLTFNGTSQSLVMTGHPFPLDDGNIEVRAVVQQDEVSGTAGNKFVILIGGTGSTFVAINRFTNNLFRAVSAGSDAVYAINPSQSRHLVRGVFKTGEQSIQVDGATPVTGITDPAIAAGDYRVGSNLSGTGAYWNGKMRDLIVTSLLTSKQTTLLDTYGLARRAL